MQLFLKGMRLALVAAIVLAVPAFALTMVVSNNGMTQDEVAIVAQDDPVANGLKIYTKPAPGSENVDPNTVTAVEIPTEVRALRWTFTATTRTTVGPVKGTSK